MIETTVIRRPALVTVITVLASFAASCSTASSQGEGSPVSVATPSPSPSQGPADDEPTGGDLFGAAEDFLTSKVGVRWIGYRRATGTGRLPGIGGYTLFLVTRPEGIGITLRVAGGEPTTACCLRPVRRGARPLAYIRMGPGRGILLAHLSPLVETVTYECVGCDDVEGLISRLARGRVRGVPQLALVLIQANVDGGNDGHLVSFDVDGERVDRDWIGVPPACSGPSCPTGSAWGLLELGTERHFGP